VFVALPRTAALYIAQEAIPPITEAAGHGRQRIDLGVIDEAGEQRADMTVVGVRPGIIARNADDEPARELIIAAVS
jgi:hypothetical protein